MGEAVSTATVREQLEDVIKRLNVGHLMFLSHFGDMPREKTMYNTEMIAKEVLPHLRPMWSEWEDHWYPKGLSQEELRTPAALANGK